MQLHAWQLVYCIYRLYVTFPPSSIPYSVHSARLLFVGWMENAVEILRQLECTTMGSQVPPERFNPLSQ
jgi:hypothetical protein